MGFEGELDGLGRMVASLVAGALLGIEREAREKPAGVRTYALVALGACIFTLVGTLAFGEGDPGSRVAAQIVTGIGFIGAGTILHQKGIVVGLTTAAGIWACAAIGMAFGGGLYLLGTGGTIMAVIVLRLLEWRTGRREQGIPPSSDKARSDEERH